jgi:hypothetical protein
MRAPLLSVLSLLVLAVTATSALAASRSVRMGDDWLVAKGGAQR